MLAVLRARRCWGGAGGAGLRAALAATSGWTSGAAGRARRAGRRAEALPRWSTARTTAADRSTCWRRWPGAGRRLETPAGTPARPPWSTRARRAPTDVVAVLRFAATEVVPRLAAHHRRDRPTCCAPSTAATSPAGPSGSPTRGLVNVLPTGRNFYSVDPKAIPSRNAWDVGVALADSLLARHLADTGEYPRSVGLTVWGTSAMRTQGDDIAEMLALLGLPAGVGRRVAPGHRLRGRARWPSWAGRAST